MSTSEGLEFVPVGREFAERFPSASRSPLERSPLESNTSDPAIPTTLQQLTNSKSDSYQLTFEQAVSLDIPVVPINANGQQSVFVQEFIQFRDLPQLSGTVRYGIAIRWCISVVKVSANAKVDKAPLIAASVEFGFVRASAVFQVIGMQSAAINKLIPTPDSLTVDNYALFAQRLGAIKDLIFEPNTLIVPTCLAVTKTVADHFR